MSREYRSRCGDLETKRTAHNMVNYYEALGYQAQREKNEQMAQTYWQHAEHYRKENEWKR